MKYEKEFIDFLEYDKRHDDYYYSIEYINVIKGSKDKNYYEIFINHLNEIEETQREDIILEGFISYLDRYNIDYDLEEVYYDTSEYIDVCDADEYIGDDK